MNFLARLFGRPGATAPEAPSNSRLPQGAAAASRDPHHELLRVVLRGTLHQHGIPAAWMGAEVLPAGMQQGQPALHLRLLIMQMDPRLLSHGMAFEQSFKEHLATFDPAAARWLTGISWQFALPKGTPMIPMPEASAWTGQAAAAASAAPVAAAASAAGPAPDAAAPVRKGMTRAELDKLFDGPKSESPSAPAPAPDGKSNFEATQRMTVEVQPEFESTRPLSFESTQRLPGSSGNS